MWSAAVRRVVSAPARPAVNVVARRRLGGGGGGHGHGGGGGGSGEYGGFHEPHVARWHQVAGETMMTVMWLWVFYRAKEDLTFVLGLEHPWDAHGDHGHGHGDHGHGHDSEPEWTRDAPGARPTRQSGGHGH